MAPVCCLYYGVMVEWVCEASLAWHLFAALTAVPQFLCLCGHLLLTCLLPWLWLNGHVVILLLRICLLPVWLYHGCVVM